MERRDIDLRRDGEIAMNLTGKIHQLPCCIKFNGPTSVSHYFKPKPSGEMEVDGLRVEEVYFRGRKLHGTTISLPQGYTGSILGKKTFDKDGNSTSSNCWNKCATFQNLTIWNHDVIPSKEDAFLRALHWLPVAQADAEDVDNVLYLRDEHILNNITSNDMDIVTPPRRSDKSLWAVATVLDANLNIVASERINFDSELSNYKTKDGVYRDPSVNGRIVSPTVMWVEALDLILQRLEKSKLDFGKIAAVSGSGQQHGSVYWKNGSSSILSSLDSKKALVDQFGDAFSVKESPIWMDSSTTEQCKEIEKSVGGGLELSKLTGSRAYERFTGPQIRRIFETQPEAYKNTERISLVSSFMASLFIGKYACIDQTDGAGMNLMDIKERAWSKLILEATAPGLEEKLGKLAPAHAVAGLIAPYFVERYKFDKNCLIIQWSGDNPNSLAGLTLSSPGDLAISLGTSDTVFGITDEPKPCLEGHVFPNPVDEKGYMVMLCYKNGSLTREDIRNRCADKSWDVFNSLLQESPPLNGTGGKIGFYYKEHEILPPLPVGYHRYVLENFNGDSLDGVKEHEVDAFDPASEVRALVEGQLLSMRAHTERFGLPSPPNHSASMGAALRAAHGWLCNKKGGFVPISSMYADKLEQTSLNCKLAATPGDQGLVTKYALLVKKRMEIENNLVKQLGRL
ncbi:xylulose kinase [Dorcoceras hygrometricum]|uniref:Xylulose kinase n=1 Tax=Dorcoceras hygrometricum TaxID=472368 RepID=A0A2Z7BAI6_9LAMI|nr:xylulose kinase [Dorcoceras hygrometricum]